MRSFVFRRPAARTRKTANGSTKGDRFRSVEIGPGLSRTLQDQLARRAEMARGDQQNAPVFVADGQLQGPQLMLDDHTVIDEPTT